MKPKNRTRKYLFLRRFIAWGLLILLLTAFHKLDTFHKIVQYLPKIQFGQTLAGFFSHGTATAAVTFLTLAVLTVIFGRFFCGFICPLGAFMDLSLFIRSKIKKRPFNFAPNRFYRLIVPALLLIAFWVGFPFPFGYFEPYSLFVSGHALLLIIVILAVLKGRAFCDLLCPPGLVLKLLSGPSVFGFKLDQNTCLKCGACQKVCPTSCVNASEKTLENSRCLLCLECAAICPNGSLNYGLIESPQAGRRRFLKLAATGTLAAGAYLTSDELRAKTFGRPNFQPILPPGALSLAHLNAHCTLCHTCVSACPNGAIQPSHSALPVLMAKPLIEPYQGFCQYDCVVCGEVCPTGALLPLSVEAKRLTRLGLAKLNRNECVVVKNRTSCGACAELCPTGSVRMAPGPSGQDEPTMDTDYCIGCGACQKACPVRPVAAIVVEGLTFQQTAKTPKVIETQDLTLTDDFPF
ncbi:MAG: 4Fe-4S binding protein [Deltaproteobacteria bacterium]|jgi:polyferredoxin|nr:4Fe-4S binding protein [Deltaproteobacteria bacterium]